MGACVVFFSELVTAPAFMCVLVCVLNCVAKFCFDFRNSVKGDEPKVYGLEIALVL